MKEKFVIKGGNRLEGEVEIRGSKNAAAAIISAVLLTKEECIISNVPLVKDILNLLDILKEMGVEVRFLAKRKISIKATDIDLSKLNYNKFSKARTSVLLIGSLVTRCKEFRVPKPGGDRIGLRPINTHLNALQKLGIEIKKQEGDYYFFTQQLIGKKIVLPEFSVTATEILILASCTARGKTLIKTAAQEPHVRDLIKMVNKMGGKIKTVGPNEIEIEGVTELKGVEHEIISDYIEAGTFLVFGIATHGRIKVKNVNVDDLDIFLEKLREMGVSFKISEREIEVFVEKELKAVKIQALPYPGFPTDLLPLMVPLLIQSKGKSLIHDPLYENRLHYVQELRKMGADIEIVDPHRAFVLGKTPLHGVEIKSWDIRAGATLIVAGLMAEKETVINAIDQIDRGYENIEERLQLLGADITRI